MIYLSTKEVAPSGNLLTPTGEACPPPVKNHCFTLYQNRLKYFIHRATKYLRKHQKIVHPMLRGT